MIIEGKELSKKNQFDNEEIFALINFYKKTLNDKEIVTKISDKLNVSKRVVYQLIINNK